MQRILRHSALTEEVVEDTYFQVWRQAPRYDLARGRPLAWLLCIARSRALEMLRHEARFDHLSLDTDDAIDALDATVPATDEWLDCTRGHRLLYEALTNLGAPSRQLLALAFFRGLSHDEIAEQTNLPLGTIKSQIRRSLITLRKTLGDNGLHALPR